MRRNIGLAEGLFSNIEKHKNLACKPLTKPEHSTSKRISPEDIKGRDYNKQIQKYNKVTPRTRYEAKCEKESYDAFNSQDLLFFFLDKAEAVGVKIVITNNTATMRQFKLLLQKGYTPLDIVIMIEFLFHSGQTYLETSRLTPGIFFTNWCTTIYQDSKLWLEDKYDPTTPKTKASVQTHIKNREWQERPEDNQESAKIGEWGL